MGFSPLFAELPDHWETPTLGEIVKRGGGSIQTGPFGSQLHAHDYVDDGIPSIMPVNIGDNRLIEQDIKRITEEDAERLSKHRVQVGDIIYSRRGDVERRAIVREGQEGWLCGTGCLKVRFGEGVIDPDFASFYLGHPAVRAWIVNHAVGATMPNLNTGIMERVPFVLPPLSEQRAIAGVLGSLDAKIALNRRMSRTLESLARGLFQSWFVDFDPAPDHPHTNAAPFEPSPLGDIPQGWTVKTIGDLCDINASTLRKKDELDSLEYIEISAANRGDIESMPRYDRDDAPGRARRRLRHGDVAISTVRPDRGAYFLALDPPADRIASTGFAVMSPKVPYSFLYVLMTRPEMSEKLGQLADGAAYPAVKPEQIEAIEAVVPTDPAILDAFHAVVAPLLERMEQNRQESRTLAALRDALLPKLLGGELGAPTVGSNA
ncbi:MAG: restriction endonuclease subunit S [Planctomycetota bacterium]